MLLGKVCQPGPPLKVFSQLGSTVDVQGAIAAGPGGLDRPRSYVKALAHGTLAVAARESDCHAGLELAQAGAPQQLELLALVAQLWLEGSSEDEKDEDARKEPQPVQHAGGRRERGGVSGRRQKRDAREADDLTPPTRELTKADPSRSGAPT